MSFDINYTNLARSFFSPNLQKKQKYSATDEQISSIAKDLQLIGSDCFDELYIKYAPRFIQNIYLPKSSFSITELANDQEFMTKNTEEKQYIIREITSRICEIFSKDEKQTLYKTLYNQAVDEIENLISKKEPFRDVLAKTAKLRKEIAYKCYDPQITDFGTFRYLSLWSYCLASPKLDLNEVEEYVKGASNEDELPNNPFNYDLSDEKRRTIKGQINGHEISLSHLIFVPENYRCNDDAAHVLHTDPKHFDQILEAIEGLFKAIIADRLDEEQLFFQVGQLHWLLSQATFFIRGSAAISEIFCTAILQSKGLRGEIINQPDVVALVTPEIMEYSKTFKRDFWVSRETIEAVAR